jgi:choline dehydrogenase-like flavoprotein
MRVMPLSPAARRTLEALCRRIAPPPGTTSPPIDLVGEIDRRLIGLEPATERRIDMLLRFLDTRLGALLLTGRARPITRQTDGELDGTLDAWQRSPRAARRSVWQALRRLILASYYTTPAAHASIGYLGPPHRRLPRYEWEGPPVGRPSAAEPIVRVASAIERIALFDTFSPPPPTPAAFAAALVRGRDVRGEHVVRCDVCVIGSGAGGGVAADRLARAGRSVIVLEEGPFVASAEMNEDEAGMTARLYADAGARATADLAFTLLQGRNVGGGATINWMIMLRPQPSVMHEWAVDHGAELLGEAQLGPALARIEAEVHARVVPADAHAPYNRVILDGAARLGWRASAAAINADGCIRAGTCGLGCRYGAKRGAHALHLPRAAEHGARIYDDTRVDRIEVARGRAGGALKRIVATTFDRSRRAPAGRLIVEASTVVLAAGAVGTPVILQRSGFGGGGVGRFLRLHPTTAVFGEYDRPMYNAAGIPQSAVCTEFLQGENGHGFWIECPPITPGLAAAALQGFGDVHRQRMTGFERRAALIVLVRDGVERHVSNGDVAARRNGSARIRYRLGAAEKRLLGAAVAAAARLHLAAGAGHATSLHIDAPAIRTEHDVEAAAALGFEPNRVSLFSAHVNGTCRMGVDPRSSGCTPDGERHGVKGIYICDGSLLPSAPGVNPHATIMAAASLVADRIAAGQP